MRKCIGICKAKKYWKSFANNAYRVYSVFSPYMEKKIIKYFKRISKTKLSSFKTDLKVTELEVVKQTGYIHSR